MSVTHKIVLMAFLVVSITSMRAGDGAQPAKHSPEEEFRFAQGLMERKFYDMAETDFRLFVETHPGHDYAPAAMAQIGVCRELEGKAERSGGRNPDDAVRFLLAKSALVVCGTIATTPRKPPVPEGNRPIPYRLQVRVEEVLVGDRSAVGQDGTLTVVVERYDDGPPVLAEGNQCVLFLAWRNWPAPKGFPNWWTADPWMGVLPKGADLIDSIKRVPKEKAEHNERTVPRERI
jgi:hypothetical protein